MWHGLTRPARLVYWIGPPTAIIAALVVSPRVAATLPAIALPTALAIQQYRSSPPKDDKEVERCFWIYLSTGVVGLAAAAAVQCVLGYGFLHLFHGDKTLNFIEEAWQGIKELPAETLAARIADAWSWQSVAKRFFLSYIMAGLVEESIKLHPIAYLRRSQQISADTDSKATYIRYAVASALGFATMESIVGAWGLVIVGSSWTRVAVEMGERIIFGTIAHGLMTVLAAMRMSRLDDASKGDEKPKRLTFRQWMRTIGPSALFHGSFNFSLFSISAMNGSLAWEHPETVGSLVAMYTIGLGLLGMLALKVKREWVKLSRTGEEKSS